MRLDEVLIKNFDNTTATEGKEFQPFFLEILNERPVRFHLISFHEKVPKGWCISHREV